MSTELVNLSALGALATVGGLDEDTLDNLEAGLGE